MLTDRNSRDSSNSVKLINLRELFGRRYQIGYDPSYAHEQSDWRKCEEPWLQVVLCHHGEIYPWGDDRLAATTSTRGAIANKLAALECCTVSQDGSDGVTVTFHVGDFSAVAKLIRPRGRRRLSPERREAFVKAGRSHRYRKTVGQTQISGASYVSGATETTSFPPEPVRAS